MPSAQNHLLQYKKNKMLINSSLFKIDSCQHLDWLITILFYSALHLVEKGLEEKGHSLHGSKINHEVRNNRVAKIFPEEVAANYSTLYQNSKKARYFCIPISSKQATDSAKCLETIERYLLYK